MFFYNKPIFGIILILYFVVVQTLKYKYIMNNIIYNTVILVKYLL